MRRSLWMLLPGIASLAVGLAVLLWPMHESGVTGSALRPHYGDYGWFSYENTLSTSPYQSRLVISADPTPQDRVNDRRHAAEGFGVLGVLLIGAGVVSGRRRARPAAPADPA